MNEIVDFVSDISFVVLGLAFGYLFGRYVESLNWASYSMRVQHPDGSFGVRPKLFKCQFYWVSRADLECDRCQIHPLMNLTGEPEKRH